MNVCESCHHLPSGRFDSAGRQCHCKCHDDADKPTMYLIMTEHSVYQTSNLRTDSNFLGWVFDVYAKIFRLHEGKYQRMIVKSEPRPSNPKMTQWTYDWIDVKEGP